MSWWNPIDILRRTDRLLTRGEEFMSQVTDLIKQFKDATDALAVRIQALTARLIAAEANVVTPADQAEIDSIVAQLNALGRDPANPVPTP